MSYGLIAAGVVFVYLGIVLYVGIFAFRRATTGAEDFFVANRSLGTFVFLLSLFGSNMTSFAILGSSGLAFRMGIGVYGLMASISAIIIPLSIFIVGTRLWAIGKKYGLVTQVQIFRDRWEMGHIGTVIFALQALMLVPYIIIGVMGGGETLEGVSNEAVPYWFGGLIVALVVMSYVFFGGMRGTAWVNTLQTLMFLVFGTITFFIIARGMGGFGNTVKEMVRTLGAEKGSDPVVRSTLRAVPATGSDPFSAPAELRPAGDAAARSSQPTTRSASPVARPDGELLTRSRISKGYYFSYALIPLSSIMFPHIAIFCLTARRMSSFRKTVIFYPLCIMAIWLPAVFLGTMATSRPEVIADTAAKSQEAQDWLHARGSAGHDGKQVAPRLTQILHAAQDRNPKVAEVLRDVEAGQLTHDQLGDRLDEIQRQLPPLKPELRRLASTNSDGIMLALLTHFSPALLAGILGAAIMACVMASDSQILALATMWAEDIYGFYGGRQSHDDRAKVWSARLFVIVLTVAAYAIAIAVHEYANIFDVAIQYAFSGYASMTPIMLACLFWRRSTKWGALLATVWVAGCLIANFVLQYAFQSGPYMPASPLAGPIPIWSIGDTPILLREYNRISFTDYRFLLVLPMFVGSVIMVVLGSLLTRPPSVATIERYFPRRPAGLPAGARSAPSAG